MSELDALNIALGFQIWAEGRGYDLNLDAEGDFINLETRATWIGFEAAHGPAGSKGAGQQIYGRIKRSSDYAHQSEDMFPVVVGKPPHGDFAVQGGPGGLYRLKDMEFFVIDDGKQYRLK